ncbi:hypothetical protein AB205_0137800 [Aquarana catesbeiana]|uniref:Uncharacterized protein n=1 Tax=Aquarana catesbeiana TaxID=8400 RepID=A0A2G9SHJ4_AQUCT|nr:hypothetical protein AB205_0137800 [Aquarana catesbeiana]
MSTVTPSLAPPSCTEESPELFDHSVGYMLQWEAIELVEEREKEHRGLKEQEVGRNMYQHPHTVIISMQCLYTIAAAYCQVCSSDEEGGDNEVTDSTWVPDRREEEEAHPKRGRMPYRGQLKGSHPIASHRRAPCIF